MNTYSTQKNNYHYKKIGITAAKAQKMPAKISWPFFWLEIGAHKKSMAMLRLNTTN
jgi:hypothetical protein